MIFSTLEDILATDFEAAIFDFDGTIAHTHHIWKLVDQEFFESRGIPYTPEIGKILSLDLKGEPNGQLPPMG